MKIPDGEKIVEAVKEMAEKLGVPGSVAGSYDLYRAVLEEFRLAKPCTCVRERLRLRRRGNR